MIEVCFEEKKSLLEIPDNDGRLYGILLPTSYQLTKDDLGDCKQFDTRIAAQLLQINRKIGEYTKQYGERAFYLGTYSNPKGGRFRLFSFPVRHKIYECSDLTVLSNSCQQIVSMQSKFKCDRYFLPWVGCDLGATSYASCVKPVLDVILDDNFIMIHRRGIEDG